MDSALHDRMALRLRSLAAADGGFGPRPAQPAEAEPTAVAALALDDDGARRWLARSQRSDGTLSTVPGPVQPAAATALSAMAMADDDARRRALDALVRLQAPQVRSEPAAPHDASTRGWGWTPRTFGWVEPTAWCLLALRLLRPAASVLVDDGERVLADRECVGGGWNYGNRTVLDEHLPPYVQTTATALLALQASSRTAAVQRGVATLLERWPSEPGGLSLGLTLAALRLHGGAGADDVAAALGRTFERTAFLDDVLALAWAVLASGPGLEQLRVPR